MRCTLAIDSEKFREDLGRGVQTILGKRYSEWQHPRMPLITRIGERNPIEGIDKKPPHAGRFGRP